MLASQQQQNKVLGPLISMWQVFVFSLTNVVIELVGLIIYKLIPTTKKIYFLVTAC